MAKAIKYSGGAPIDEAGSKAESFKRGGAKKQAKGGMCASGVKKRANGGVLSAASSVKARPGAKFSASEE